MGKAAILFTVIEGIIVSVAAVYVFLAMDTPIGLAFVLPVIGVMVAETCVSVSKGFKSIALGVLNIIYCSRIGGILYLIWKPEPLSVVIEVPQVPEGLPADQKVPGTLKNSSVKVTVEIRQEESAGK